MNILFITGGSPWPTTLGVNQRTCLLYKALSECGRVDLIINSQYVAFSEEEEEMMRTNYGLLYLANPLHPYLMKRNNFKGGLNLRYLYLKKLEDWYGHYLTNKENNIIVSNFIKKNQYHIVVTRYLRSSVNTGAFNYTPSVLDVDDLNMDMVRKAYEKKKSNMFKRILWPVYCKIIEMIELRYLSKIDFLWFSKASDQLIVSNKRSCVLPNIPFSEEGRKSKCGTQSGKEHIVLFVGGMKHTVNIKGIDRFIKEIWPNIIAVKPDAVLRVVGTGMTEEKKTAWNRHKGVQAVGFVEDIESEYANCAFSIIPLSEGGGTKIKLLESLRYERTCVTDVHSVAGYEHILKDDEDVCIVESDEEFAIKCLELFNNPEKRKKMANKGREKVDKHYNYQAFKKIVQNTLNSIACQKEYVREK